ncbi:MAG: 3-beta hydroxysteroid dehydrogenase [Elusimicrobia bacterium RIFOXYA2_FULL_58_8]|nr:MAG: 3-beta hydroxysteroid dehydrogenase [Elusimicrobia bacterium RIFOXYA12_FULL_57_11]OGS13148.1 MAG: 3-beta hydroxysteroid dehydrogenase [Elusimicrobia bacterium RIFOXYA2_FULL_58_8]
MKALVTGGGGFLGGALVELLLSKGAAVRSLARGEYPRLVKPGVECVQGDIADPAAAALACQGCDTVFHVAAKVGMWGRYRDFHATNVTGTANLLAAAKAAGASRFIFTSSPSVIYAAGDAEGVKENVPYPARFDSHYAKTKAAAEQLVLAENSPRFSTISLRPHLVWGPGRDHLVSRIVSQGKAGKLRRIGGFNKLIDTTYIDDAVMAHWLAAEKLSPDAACAGKAYFISQGDPRPNWDIINMILAAAGAGPVIKTIPYTAAYAAAAFMETAWRLAQITTEPPLTRFVVQQLTTAHWFDISAARRDLGYKPGVTIEQGMKNLSHWFKTV